MKAIAVTCPHCGARLSVDGARDSVRCEYCGTDARIQRRTQMLQRVMPPPSAAAGAPRAIAVQQRTGAGIAIVLACLLVPLGIMVGVLVFVRGVARTVTEHVGSVTSSPDAPTWQGTESVIIVDGVLVGRSRRLGNSDEIRIVALDAATGKQRWETDRLGNYNETYQGFVARAGDLILFASPRGEVKAFALADGKARWTAKLPERVGDFCAHDTAIAVRGVDEVVRGLARADGKPVEVTMPEAPVLVVNGKKRKLHPNRAVCSPLPSDRDPKYERPEWELGRKLDLNPDALAVGKAGRVLSGTRSKGTQVPTLVALDDGDNQRWRVDVPTDPLASVGRAPQHVVVGDSQVCGAYYADSVAKPLRIACFAMADGKRLWDAEQSEHSPLEAILISKYLLVSMWGTLEAHDLATGALVWKYGK